MIPDLLLCTKDMFWAIRACHLGTLHRRVRGALATGLNIHLFGTPADERDFVKWLREEPCIDLVLGQGLVFVAGIGGAATAAFHIYGSKIKPGSADAKCKTLARLSNILRSKAAGF